MTPAEQAAALWAQQNPNFVGPTPQPQTAAAIQSNPALSFQQKHAQLNGGVPVIPPPPPPPAPILTPEQQIYADAKAGKISYQQELAALKNPATYVNPNTGKAPLSIGTPPPDAPVAKPATLTKAPAAQPPSEGAAEGQANPLDGALQAVLAPRNGAGIAPHPAGYSPADKAFRGSLQEQGAVAQQNAAQTGQDVQKAQEDYANNSAALAYDSQMGAWSYQQQMSDNAKRRKQLDGDAQDAQRRIESKLADLEATGTDPNRYFHMQSTGQNILGALLVGLGGFGAHALGPGGHDSANTALEIMNNGITRDVDAQKADLSKSLNVLGQRMNLNAEGFNQQKALLEAERESYQTSYQIAINETAKRAAQFKDNADVQMNAAKIQDGLRTAAADKIGTLNGQIYSLDKGAERIVGGASGKEDPREWIRKRTSELVDKAGAAGKVLSAHDAGIEAVKEYAQVNLDPTRPQVDIASPPKGATAGGARLLRPLPGHMTNLDRLHRLDGLLNQKVLGPEDKAEANQILADLKEAHLAGLPENVGTLDLGRLTGSQKAAVHSAIRSEESNVANIKDVSKNAAGAGAPADEPAAVGGVEAEDDEEGK